MSQIGRPRRQFGLRHLMLVVAAVAVLLAAIQMATRPGTRGDGARVFLLFVATTAAPLGYVTMARRSGQCPILAGGKGGLITAPIAWLLLAVPMGLGAHHVPSADVVVNVVILLVFVVSVEFIWGVVIGLIGSVGGFRSRRPPRPIESEARGVTTLAGAAGGVPIGSSARKR